MTPHLDAEYWVISLSERVLLSAVDDLEGWEGVSDVQNQLLGV